MSSESLRVVERNNDTSFSDSGDLQRRQADDSARVSREGLQIKLVKDANNTLEEASSSQTLMQCPSDLSDQINSSKGASTSFPQLSERPPNFLSASDETRRNENKDSHAECEEEGIETVAITTADSYSRIASSFSGKQDGTAGGALMTNTNDANSSTFNIVDTDNAQENKSDLQPDTETDEEDREFARMELEQKRLSSRLSSRRSQERKRKRIEYLTNQKECLEKANNSLRTQNQGLREAIMRTRSAQSAATQMRMAATMSSVVPWYAVNSSAHAFTRVSHPTFSTPVFQFNDLLLPPNQISAVPQLRTNTGMILHRSQILPLLSHPTLPEPAVQGIPANYANSLGVIVPGAGSYAQMREAHPHHLMPSLQRSSILPSAAQVHSNLAQHLPQPFLTTSSPTSPPAEGVEGAQTPQQIQDHLQERGKGYPPYAPT